MKVCYHSDSTKGASSTTHKESTVLSETPRTHTGDNKFINRTVYWIEPSLQVYPVAMLPRALAYGYPWLGCYTRVLPHLPFPLLSPTSLGIIPHLHRTDY